MQFTIKQKLVGIGAVSVISLAILTGISFFLGFQVKDASALNEQRNAQINNVAGMQLATYEIMLAAMDSIIDKDEGTITPDRKVVIEENIAYMKEHVVQLIEDSDTDEERQIAEGLNAKIGGLEKGILVDLQGLLEKRAPDSAFAAIDDTLDENGIGMNEELAAFSTSVQAEVDEAVEEMHDALTLSKTLTLGASVVSGGLLVVLLVIIGRSITGPVTGMTGAMTALSGGNKDIDIPGVGQSDEIGQMADAVQVFKDSIDQGRQIGRRTTSRTRISRTALQTHRNADHDFRRKRFGHAQHGVVGIDRAAIYRADHVVHRRSDQPASQQRRSGGRRSVHQRADGGVGFGRTVQLNL